MASSGVDIHTEMNIQIMPVACSHLDVNAIRKTTIECMVNGGSPQKRQIIKWVIQNPKIGSLLTSCIQLDRKDASDLSLNIKKKDQLIQFVGTNQPLPIKFIN